MGREARQQLSGNRLVDYWQEGNWQEDNRLEFPLPVFPGLEAQAL